MDILGVTATARSHHFCTWKNTQKLAFFSMFACQKLLSTFHNSLQHCIFQSKAKFDEHTLFFQVHHYLGMEKLQWYSYI
jgi:hypothetical protein